MVLCGKRWHDFFIVCHNLMARRWYARVYAHIFWKTKIGPKVSIYLQKNMPSRVRNKEINIYFFPRSDNPLWVFYIVYVCVQVIGSSSHCGYIKLHPTADAVVSESVNKKNYRTNNQNVIKYSLSVRWCNYIRYVRLGNIIFSSLP